jgi:hypothetical protein
VKSEKGTESKSCVFDLELNPKFSTRYPNKNRIVGLVIAKFMMLVSRMFALLLVIIYYMFLHPRRILELD